MNRLITHYTIWKIMALNAVQETFVNRWSNSLFLLGKFLRLSMSLVFLFLIRNTTKEFGSYTTDQLIIFYLTYQIIDGVAQSFYRGVYSFSPLVKNGEFDFLLAKPINPLFRALTGKPDINDVIFLIPTIFLSVYISTFLNISITLTSFFWYIFLLINSFLITTAFHIFVLTIGIMTTEVDGVIWMYRDVSRLAQFPISVYQQPLRFVLFFLVPIGIMVTIPAEILLNTKPTYSILVATCIGVGSFIFSLRLWNWGLKQYSSASS